MLRSLFAWNPPSPGSHRGRKRRGTLLAVAVALCLASAGLAEAAREESSGLYCPTCGFTASRSEVVCPRDGRRFERPGSPRRDAGEPDAWVGLQWNKRTGDVLSVVAGSPADHAAIRPGDRIFGWGAHEVGASGEPFEPPARKGEEVTVSFLRGPEARTTVLTPVGVPDWAPAGEDVTAAQFLRDLVSGRMSPYAETRWVRHPRILEGYRVLAKFPVVTSVGKQQALYLVEATLPGGEGTRTRRAVLRVQILPRTKVLAFLPLATARREGQVPELRGRQEVEPRWFAPLGETVGAPGAGAGQAE